MENKKISFTRLVKHFRSNPLHALLRSSIARFSQTKFRNCVAHSYGACFAAINGHATAKPLTSALCRKAAFTLAETMIVVVVLGLIASLVVPQLVNKNIERTNRTKVKKAMAAYEKALNQMIVDNDIKGDVSALNDSECTITRPYFKAIENGDNNCHFKTADKIWWDITDIQNPIISTKAEITNSNANTIKTNSKSVQNDKTSFGMIGRLDDSRILRINDNVYEQQNGTLANKNTMIKLWSFVNNTEGEEIKYNASSELITAMTNQCTSQPYKSCRLVDSNGTKIYDSYGNLVVTSSNKNCFTSISAKSYCSNSKYYDENGNLIIDASVGSDRYFVIDSNGNIISIGGTLYNKDGEILLSNGYYTTGKMLDQTGALYGYKREKLVSDDFSEVIFTCTGNSVCKNINHLSQSITPNNFVVYNDDWSEIVFTCNATNGAACYRQSQVQYGSMMPAGNVIYNNDYSEVIVDCAPKGCRTNDYFKSVSNGIKVYDRATAKVVCECADENGCKKTNGVWSGCKEN